MSRVRAHSISALRRRSHTWGDRGEGECVGEGMRAKEGVKVRGSVREWRQRVVRMRSDLRHSQQSCTVCKWLFAKYVKKKKKGAVDRLTLQQREPSIAFVSRK